MYIGSLRTVDFKTQQFKTKQLTISFSSNAFPAVRRMLEKGLGAFCTCGKWSHGVYLCRQEVFARFEPAL